MIKKTFYIFKKAYSKIQFMFQDDYFMNLLYNF